MMKAYDVVALGELLIGFAPYSVNKGGYPVLSAHPGGAPGKFVMNERGGKATGIYASLIAIAKLNHLDPFKYMVWLLEAGAQGHFHDPNQMERYMPWNAPDPIKASIALTKNAALA